MGSWGSGRYRTSNRGAVEASLRVDMRFLRHRGYLLPGQRVSGSLQWESRGQPSGSIRIAVDLTNQHHPIAILNFSVDGEPREQTVALEADECRYGGHRYYFLCPRTWARCEVLCGVGGYFASRRFHRLTYQSQTADRLDRLRFAQDKAEARLRGSGRHPRPRGANRERLLERWCDASEAWEAEFAGFAARRFGIALK